MRICIDAGAVVAVSRWDGSYRIRLPDARVGGEAAVRFEPGGSQAIQRTLVLEYGDNTLNVRVARGPG